MHLKTSYSMNFANLWTGLHHIPPMFWYRYRLIFRFTVNLCFLFSSFMMLSHKQHIIILESCSKQLVTCLAVPLLSIDHACKNIVTQWTRKFNPNTNESLVHGQDHEWRKWCFFAIHALMHFYRHYMLTLHHLLLSVSSEKYYVSYDYDYIVFLREQWFQFKSSFVGIVLIDTKWNNSTNEISSNDRRFVYTSLEVFNILILSRQIKHQHFLVSRMFWCTK